MPGLPKKSITDIEVKGVRDYQTHVTLPNDEPLVLRGVYAGAENESFSTILAKRYMNIAGKNIKKFNDRANELVVELFPTHIITGWNAVDAAGKPIPYDAALCREELAEWRATRISKLQAFFANEANFLIEVPTEQDGVVVGNESGDTCNGDLITPNASP